MKIKKVKSKLTSMLLATVILLVNFNFLPVQSMINQSMSTGTVVAYAATTKPGKWIKESNGKWWYKHTDGTYTKNNWEYIDGYWYHFDANGYMQTGWLKVDGKWYHLNSEGKMHIGWVKIGNYWYHFDSNGVRQTGWQKLNGEWYYFNSDGIRQVGWQQVDGKWYHLDSNGIMETGWVKIGNYWYHFDSNGVRQTGWQKLNGEWYYFNSDGIRQVGWQQVDGKWYHLDSNGIMETGWVKIGTDWYYFNSSGVRQTGWLKLDNKWYYLNSNGVMRTEPITIGTRRYEFNKSGDMYVSEILVNRQEQNKKNWCWAASSVMIGTYNTNSIATQEDIVARIKGSADIDEGGTKYEEAQAIYFASSCTKLVTSYDIIGFDKIVSEIDNNKPFLISMIWDSGSGGHAIVCAGYKLLSDENLIRIIDPGRNCGIHYYPYGDIISGSTISSGTGKCRLMITYKIV